ncbi:hypothetical protein CMT75_18675 [Elizabethkingia anophelis]|nr:hypothetical protein [Elizabethkingia anophelis]
MENRKTSQKTIQKEKHTLLISKAIAENWSSQELTKFIEEKIENTKYYLIIENDKDEWINLNHYNFEDILVKLSKDTRCYIAIENEIKIQPRGIFIFNDYNRVASIYGKDKINTLTKDRIDILNID